jgi:cysteine-rich repeat protein
MKSRAFPYALTILVVCGGGVAWVQCSKSSCGNNKVESGEQCDKGSQNGVVGSGCSSTCTFADVPVATIQVSYMKLVGEVMGFDGVSCSDLGVAGAHVVLSGPQPVDEVWTGDNGCQQSKQYANVTPGTYQATITLLDASMAPLTNAVTTSMTDVEKGAPTLLNIDFMMKDFVKQDYTGELDLDVQWGAINKRCNESTPVIMSESVILKDANHMPVTTPPMTADGLKLDGTFGACLEASSTAPQKVIPLPWGHYFVTLQGKASLAAAVSFCQTFEVFVPPGQDPATNALVVGAYDPTADGGATCP